MCNKICTKDINGESKYFYMKDFIEQSYPTLLYKKISDDPNFKGDFFEFHVIRMNSYAKVQMMKANESKFRKQGLPEALIEYARQRLSEPIYSSALIPKGSDHLSPEGRKVWERMVESKRAIYDELFQRYRTI